MENSKIRNVSKLFVIAIAIVMLMPVVMAIDNESGATAPVMDEQIISELDTGLVISHAGINFDAANGEPDLNPKLKAESDYYIIQFSTLVNFAQM